MLKTVLRRLIPMTLWLTALIPFMAMAQTNDIITLLYEGHTDSARALIRALPPQSPIGERQFLRALAETDGSQAIAAFEALLTDTPKYRHNDFTRLRLGQAYYAQGAYRTALTQFRRIPVDYPRSRLLERAMLWAGRSCQALGLADSAASAYDWILSESRSESLTAKARSGLTQLGADTPTKRHGGTQTTPPPKHWTVQVGAFNNQARASYRKKFFEEKGYETALARKYKDGMTLHLVWVGKFRTRDEARRTGNTLKRKLGIDFTLVQTED